MKIADLNGYEIHVPTSGGKAGFGCNVTSTIQVRKDGCICKQFRFTIADNESRDRAIAKAKGFVNPSFTKTLLGSSPDHRTNRWRLECSCCGKKWEPPTTMLSKREEECPRCHIRAVVDYNEPPPKI